MTKPTSKFQLVNNPAPPASCIACGRNHKGNYEEFVDFGVSIEEVINSYGAVLFCMSCVKELLTVLPNDESLVVELAETSQLLELERARVRILLDALPAFNVDVPVLPTFNVSSDAPDSEGIDKGKSLFT